MVGADCFRRYEKAERPVGGSAFFIGCSGADFLDVEGCLKRDTGGAEGIRTLDPHDANVVLSQLSYCPSEGANCSASSACPQPFLPVVYFRGPDFRCEGADGLSFTTGTARIGSQAPFPESTGLKAHPHAQSGVERVVVILTVQIEKAVCSRLGAEGPALADSTD